MSKSLAIALIFFAASVGPLPAAVIPIAFDNTPDGLLQPPFAGSGTFSFSIDPGDGTHALTSLGVYEFYFQVGSDIFTTSELATPAGEILVILGTSAGRTIHFSNVNPWGSGPSRGSADFLNGPGAVLSFEPPAYGGNLDLFGHSGTEEHFGNYGAAGVPEPGTAATLFAGGLAIALLRRRGNSNRAS